MATPSNKHLKDQAIKEVNYHPDPWRITIRNEVIYLLDWWNTLTKQHFISSFIINGTLLGATKFQGIIPWDDDADIGIFHEDVSSIVTIITNNLSTTPFELHQVPYGYLIRGPNKAMLDLIVFAVDPLTMKLPDPIYRACYPLANGKPTFWLARLREYNIKRSELFPLVNYPFDELSLQGPSAGVAICKMAYGERVYQENKRPDGGLGVHPIFPDIVKFFTPGINGLANSLDRIFPSLIGKIHRLKYKESFTS